MSILDLWLPIGVSAIGTFIASAVIWMGLRWHNRDYRQPADEAALRRALEGAAPGFYLLPYCMDPAEFQRPDVRRKFEEGPIAYLTVAPSGVPKMGPKLVSSFLFYLFVGVLCAYLVSRTTASGAPYLEVFRVAGTVALIAHGVVLIPESIWFGRPWPMTAKSLLDAAIYGLLTGGVFGWLA